VNRARVKAFVLMLRYIDLELVEAAGVERERSAIMNRLMARDFWG
jgi:hypothetical protein